MPIRIQLLAAGIPAQTCNAILGTPLAIAAGTTTGAPAGNSQTTAVLIPSDSVLLTGTSVGSSTGYKLPSGVDATAPGTVSPGDWFQVCNQGGNTLSVYPNTATGKVQGGSAGAAFSVSNNKQAQFTYLGSDLWAADLSA